MAVSKLNQEGFGQVIRVNFNQNISAATSFKMWLQPEAGEKIQVTPTLGTSEVTVDDEVMAANEYVEYTLADGVITDYAGRWRKTATAVMSSTSEISTDFTPLRVMPSLT